MIQPRLRLGLVGGGPGSLIGPIHRLAAEMDRDIELVAGAFSSDAARSVSGGSAYGIGAERSYPSIETMLSGEASRDDGIQMVAIATPNGHHASAAEAALRAGIAVMCDKPLTESLASANTLAAIVRTSGVPFAISYTYSGYPLVREARALVGAGRLGVVRKVVVEYPQGWLASDTGGKQADWRTDPARAGSGGCIADIGVHAFHLAEFVTGMRVVRLFADLGTVVPGRRLDDDCQLLLRFDNGARGALLASQISVGERNGLRIRVYGDRGGMDWCQEEPNRLWLYAADGRTELIQAGDPSLRTDATDACRTPGGHPEGYLEAFANIYRDFAQLIRGGSAPLLPGIDEGLRGMVLIDLAVRASRAEANWVDFPAGADA